MESLRCYNRGCGKDFMPDENDVGDPCKFHPGMPYFHDAYKGWSCCQNKSTDFTVFLNFPGCTSGKHSNVKPKTPSPPPKADDEEAAPQKQEVRQPVTGSKLARPPWEDETALVRLVPTRAKSLVVPAVASVANGSKEGSTEKELTVGELCKNGGCKRSYTGNPDEDDVECVYHPGVPIFHEGMKYWSCCQKKTSDFQSFLAQVGCTTGKCKWLKDKAATTATGAAVVECRRDWHQTPNTMTVAVYAKKYDPDRSFVEVSPVRLRMKVVFPETDEVFNWDIELCGMVTPSKCKASMMGTKIEIQLCKAEINSWAKLDMPRKPSPAQMKKQEEEEAKRKEEEEAERSQVDAVDLDDLDLSGPKLVLSDAASGGKTGVEII